MQLSVSIPVTRRSVGQFDRMEEYEGLCEVALTGGLDSSVKVRLVGQYGESVEFSADELEAAVTALKQARGF